MEKDFNILLTQEYKTTAATIFRLIQNGLFFKMTGADSISFDFRKDGKFSLLFHDRGRIQGTISEIIPDQKILLNWSVKGFGRDEEPGTLVTLLLIEDFDNVTLEVSHQGIRSKESAEAKQRAWSEILSGIKRELSPGS